jgi:diphthine-ammonia ligase
LTTNRPLRAAISWSAGKDACLGLLRVRAEGLQVDRFVKMCEPDGLSKSHALPPELIAAQVAALGGEWQPVRVPSGAYAATFEATLAGLKTEGFDAMVFGDIDLQAHRDWLEPACERAGLQALFPLWGEPRAALAQAVIASRIRARLVCVDTRWLDASFCGAAYDAALLARLPAGVCPVGEAGEFHTVVLDGPGFAAPLVVQDLPPHRVATQPPWAPTVWVFQPLAWPAGAGGVA